MKGSKLPVELYTFDITTVPPGLGCYCGDSSHRATADFANDEMIAALQLGLSDKFKSSFTAGVAAYLQGHWVHSRELLTAAMAAKPEDGPSETLLHHMAETCFEAPSGWDGCRELTEK